MDKQLYTLIGNVLVYSNALTNFRNEFPAPKKELLYIRKPLVF